MSKYTNALTAEQLIAYIANDYVELSHEKIAWQRDDHMKICREWLKTRWAEEKAPVPSSQNDPRNFDDF